MIYNLILYSFFSIAFGSIMRVHRSAMGSNYSVEITVGDVFDFTIIYGEIRAERLGVGEILRNWV